MPVSSRNLRFFEIALVLVLLDSTRVTYLRSAVTAGGLSTLITPGIKRETRSNPAKPNPDRPITAAAKRRCLENISTDRLKYIARSPILNAIAATRLNVLTG